MHAWYTVLPWTGSPAGLSPAVTARTDAADKAITAVASASAIAPGPVIRSGRPGRSSVRRRDSSSDTAVLLNLLRPQRTAQRAVLFRRTAPFHGRAQRRYAGVRWRRPRVSQC